MEILNAPTRETCVVRRERTNTPLQALVTLNDPDFFAAARALAKEATQRSAAPLDYVARRLLARRLTQEETTAAERTRSRLVAHYRLHEDEARTISGRPDANAAAWVMLVSQLMTLDEVLNK
jgi:hypothetical protein